jgi:hypothetical protein
MTRYLAPGPLAVAVFLGTCFAAAAGETRPFHGSGYEQITGVNETGNVLTTDGEGVATHLGHYTRHLVVTINEDLSLDGHLVITAANGDKLCIHLTGSFITLSGTYTIIGGTGRFADASGSADFSATFIAADTAVFTFDGTISY